MRGNALCLTIVLLATAGTAHAQQRRVEVRPYIDASQVLTANNDQDVVTYTTVSVGVDATVQTRRVELSAAYRYEHRFSYDDKISDSSVHSGIARAAVRVGHGLTIEGGALATRARVDIRGDNATVLAGNVNNVSQVYSAYAGPTYAGRLGPATVNAGYRFGYTRAESPGVTGIGATATPIDYFDQSTSHLATVSAGVRAGALLPIGFTASAGWQQENAGQLDQRFEGKYGRFDAVLPVTPFLAVVGGVGYEQIQISQRDALRDPVTTQPVRDGAGRFVTDPASPRRLAYDIEGIFYDAGVVFRPSPRTTIEARVGWRYDSMTYTGSISWQASQRMGLQVGVYDSVESFGRQLVGALASLPTSIDPQLDPFNNQFNGCVFANGGASAGGCLNSAFQSLATANYRARGVDAVFAYNGRGSRWGFGGGYANRRYLVPVGDALNGITDQSYYLQLFGAMQLGPDMGVNATLYANYLDSGLANTPDVYGAGAVTSIYRRFGRLNAGASFGVYTFGQRNVANSEDVSVQALLGVRYGL